MMKIKKIVIAVLAIISSNLYSQISTNEDTQNTLTGTNFFLDASLFNNQLNDQGKGLGFPRVDLTQFVFDTSLITDIRIASDFDGMLVYNSGEGKTLQGQGQQVDVKPGFYYFSNPGNHRNITNGKWIRLQTGAAVGGTDDTSIYKNNGTLASDRTVNLNGNKLVFTGDGNVGIGTASPISKLNVRGGTLNIGGLTEYAGGLQVQNQDASKPVFTAYGTDNAEKMRIANNGNVGIGTKSPISKLNVQNGIINIGGLSEYAGGLQVQNQDASKPVFTAYGTDNAEKMRIANNGNVGIGTKSPTQKLDVNGNVRFRNVTESTSIASTDRVMLLTANGTAKKVNVNNLNKIGDVKYSFRTGDHDGWFLLNGRSISSLPAINRSAAQSIFSTANLPDARQKVLKQKGALGSTGGSNEPTSVTILRSNLPKVNLTGTAASAGAHNHSIFSGNAAVIGKVNPGAVNLSMTQSGNNPPYLYTVPGGPLTQTKSTLSSGAHTHNVSVALNNATTQTPLSVSTEDAYLSVNVFVYLGQ